jgi:hypothetical protein
MGVFNDIMGYLHIWQMPLVLGFLAAWLLLGPALLIRSIRPIRHRVRGTTDFFWACKTMFLLGLAAGPCGALVFGLIFLLPIHALLHSLLALVFVFPTMVFVGVGLLSARLNVSMKRGLAVGARPIGGVAMLAVVLTLVGYLPARVIHQRTILREGARTNLYHISLGIQIFVNTHSRLPYTLEELVGRNKLDPQYLRSPTRPDLEVGYFYMPVESADVLQLMAVSYANPHIPGRAVMTAERGRMRVQWEDEETAAWRLKEWATPEFRRALAETEAALPPAPEP